MALRSEPWITRSSTCVASRLRASSTTKPHGLHARKPHGHLRLSWRSIRDSIWLRSFSSPLRPIQTDRQHSANNRGIGAGICKAFKHSEVHESGKLVQQSLTGGWSHLFWSDGFLRCFMQLFNCLLIIA